MLKDQIKYFIYHSKIIIKFIVTMDKLHLKIIIKFAHVFKNTSFLPNNKMCLYAVAAVETDSSSTTVDIHGGAQPLWWFPVNFQIDKSKLQSNQLLLCIKCRRSKLDFSKTVVGKVHVPLKSLLDEYRSNSPENGHKHVAFMVLSPSGKPRGIIYLSYLFGGITPPQPPQPPPHLVPSAPPLPEIENSDCISEEPAPSAPPSLLERYGLIIFVIFYLFLCKFI